MATSGSYQTTFAGYTLKTTWTASQSIVNNTSTITATHTLICGPTWDLYIGSRSNTCTIGGVTKTFTSPAISTSGGVTKTLGTTTHVINHNADGTKSVSGSTKFNAQLTIAGTYYASATASGTLSLTTIARASSIDSVTGTVNMTGTAGCTVQIDRKSSSFKHTVKFTLGSYSYTASNIATSTTYNIPKSWCNALPNATSGTATVTVTTYSGSTKIGASVSTTFKVTVPTDVAPAFTAITATRVDGSVPSAWGVYVQGKSKCTLAITGATGSYSSTIKSYSITGASISTAASSGTTSFLASTGTLTYTGKITDSRGRTATKTTSIYVYPYTAPSVTGTAYRCTSDGTTDLTSGTNIAVTPQGSYSTCGGNNVRTVKYRYKKAGESDGSYVTTTNATTVVAGGGNISTSYSYVVEMICSDYFTTSSAYTIEVGTGNAMMSFYGKTGSAFGKVAEEDGRTEFGHNVEVEGEVIVKNGEHTTRIVNNGFGAWSDFYTTAEKFWMQKPLAVIGDIYAGAAYDQKVYHEGNKNATLVRLFYGASSSAISFDASDTQVIFVTVRVASNAGWCTVCCCNYGYYYATDENNYYKFELTATGISSRLAGDANGYIYSVYAIQIS